MGKIQDGFGDSGDRLAGLVSREVDGQVGQAEDSHERDEAALGHELSTMIVRRVVAKNGVHEFHDVVNVVHERHGLLLRVGRGHKWQGSALCLTRFLVIGKTQN